MSQPQPPVKPFEVISVEPTVQRVSPTRIQDIRVVTAEAKASGVLFWFTVVPTDYNKTSIDLIAGQLAGIMDALARAPGVVGIRWEQGTDAADRFGTTVVVTVESASGQSQDDVRLTYTEAISQTISPKIKAARAKLDSIEGE